MTISVSENLDVLSKYKSIVLESLGADSVYARAKETVEELKNNGNISDSQKADIISAIVSGVITSITSSSMSTALEWAAKEKDIALKKLELEANLAIAEQDLKLRENQAHNALLDGVKLQAETQRVYGTPTYDANGLLTSLSDTGKIYTDILLTETQKAKVAEEINHTIAATEQAYATTHKVVADTVTNFGYWDYTLKGNSGIASASRTTPAGITVLSDIQAAIAKEQAKGYTYNAWANAVNSSSSMIGTALTTNYDIFGAGSVGELMIRNIKDLTANLKNASIPTF